MSEIMIKYHPSCLIYPLDLIRFPVYINWKFYFLYVPRVIERRAFSYWGIRKLIEMSFNVHLRFNSEECEECNLPLFKYGLFKNTNISCTMEEFYKREAFVKPEVIGDNETEIFLESIAYSLKYEEERLNAIKIEIFEKQKHEEREKKYEEDRLRLKRLKFGIPKKQAPSIVKKIPRTKPVMLYEYSIINGIYFLCKGQEVVYIGQSINIYNRIRQHIREAIKEFDSAFYVDVEKIHLSGIEKILITKFSPPLNKAHNRKCA